MVRGLGLVPDVGISAAQVTSRLLMVLAMAGLGLGVEVAALRRVGVQVVLAVGGSLAFLVSLSLALILGLHLGG